MLLACHVHILSPWRTGTAERPTLSKIQFQIQTDLWVTTGCILCEWESPKTCLQQPRQHDFSGKLHLICAFNIGTNPNQTFQFMYYLAEREKLVARRTLIKFSLQVSLFNKLPASLYFFGYSSWAYSLISSNADIIHLARASHSFGWSECF